MNEKSEKPFGHAAYSSRKDNAAKRLDALVQKYVDEGMAEAEAREQAMAVMRDNGRGDWRNG